MISKARFASAAMRPHQRVEVCSICRLLVRINVAKDRRKRIKGIRVKLVCEADQSIPVLSRCASRVGLLRVLAPRCLQLNQAVVLISIFWIGRIIHSASPFAAMRLYSSGPGFPPRDCSACLRPSISVSSIELEANSTLSLDTRSS